MSIADAKGFIKKLERHNNQALADKLAAVNDMLVLLGNSTKKGNGPAKFNFTREELRAALLQKYQIPPDPNQTPTDDTCFAFSETPGF